MRKIAIITGSRGEYGYIRPIIREIEKNPNLEYFVVATNMHLLTEFGYSLEEMEKDGIKVTEKVFNTFDGYTHVTMTKSLGVFLMQLPEIFERNKPDIILCAGDRGEQMMAAMAGAYMNIPVAHIQAGELSGTIDGTTRHALTKFAHLHFCAHKEFADRVKRMGEQDFRIYTTGAPQLDEFIAEEVTSEDALRQKYYLGQSKPLFLLVQHPVTEEFAHTADNMNVVLDALGNFDAEVVCILPNSDAGSKEIKNILEKRRSLNFKIYRNLPRGDYAGLMNMAKLIIGNSSSGLIEAPVFKLPAINIGSRQNNRLQASNVINVGYAVEDIKNAIHKAVSPEFKASLEKIESPYGDGKASLRIVKILSEVTIDDQLINKKLDY